MKYVIESGEYNSAHDLDIKTNKVERTLKQLKNDKYDLVFLDILVRNGFIELPNIKVNIHSAQGVEIFTKRFEEILVSVYKKMVRDSMLVIPTSALTLGLVTNLVDKIFGVTNRLEIVTWINREGTSGNALFNSQSDFAVIVAKDKKMLDGLIESPFGEDMDYLFKDRNGKYKLVPVQTESGYTYDLTYGNERISNDYGYWKYPKKEIEEELDRRFIIRRGNLKKLYLYEKKYLTTQHRPSNLVEFQFNSNVEVIEKTFGHKTISKPTIDFYIYFIRMFRKNDLNILSLFDEDLLTMYVINWENSQVKSTHTLTVIREGKNELLANAILEKTFRNTITMQSVEREIPPNDLNSAYDLNLGNILLKNPNNPINCLTELELESIIGSNKLNDIIYIKTKDTTLIEELRKEYNNSNIFCIDN